MTFFPRKASVFSEFEPGIIRGIPRLQFGQGRQRPYPVLKGIVPCNKLSRICQHFHFTLAFFITRRMSVSPRALLRPRIFYVDTSGPVCVYIFYMCVAMKVRRFVNPKFQREILVFITHKTKSIPLNPLKL